MEMEVASVYTVLTMGKDRKRKTSEDSNTNRSVKQKKKRSAPTNTSLLPPCKVCLDPAAGFHYGVNTCEACKGFFRRTLVRQGDYDCVNHDEKCDIVQDHRNSKRRMCPRCRHLKCIAVGMSPDAIKTGRYTHAKRTQDVMEYQQSLASAISVHSSQSSPEKPTSSSAVSNITSPSSISTTSDPSSPAVHNTESLRRLTPCCSAEKNSMHVVLSPSVPHNTDREMTPGCAPAALEVPTLTPGSVEVAALTPTSVEAPALTSASLEVPALTPPCLGLPSSVCSLEATRNDLASSSASPFSPEDLCSSSAFSLVDNILGHQVGDRSRLCDESETPVSSSSVSLADSSLPDSQMSPAPVHTLHLAQEASSDTMSEQDCRQLIQHVCQSHKQLILSRYNFTKEEMLEMQQLCYDNCKARMEAFGPMGNVSEEEYQEIYQTTGIDVDDRQTFVTVLTKLLDCAIRQAIAFVKTVPGFTDLSIKDQIGLIKENRYEMGLITQTTGYNNKLRVMTLPSGRCFCEHDMQKIGGKERMQQRHQCLSAIQQLGLNDEELVLFKCVILFTVGTADIDEPQKVSAIQWKMTQCLLWLLKENKRPNPHLFFARMISVFLSLKSLAVNFFEWIKSKPFTHYAQFRNNELLVEWFSTS